MPLTNMPTMVAKKDHNNKTTAVPTTTHHCDMSRIMLVARGDLISDLQIRVGPDNLNPGNNQTTGRTTTAPGGAAKNLAHQIPLSRWL